MERRDVTSRRAGVTGGRRLGQRVARDLLHLLADWASGVDQRSPSQNWIKLRPARAALTEVLRRSLCRSRRGNALDSVRRRFQSGRSGVASTTQSFGQAARYHSRALDHVAQGGLGGTGGEKLGLQELDLISITQPRVLTRNRVAGEVRTGAASGTRGIEATYIVARGPSGRATAPVVGLRSVGLVSRRPKATATTSGNGASSRRPTGSAHIRGSTSTPAGRVGVGLDLESANDAQADPKSI